MIDLWVHRDERIVYDGYDLQKDLRKAYRTGSKTCTITYLNSAKRPVAMSFDDMMRRIPDLTRVKQAIGYQPKYSLEATLAAIIEHERKQMQ